MDNIKQVVEQELKLDKRLAQEALRALHNYVLAECLHDEITRISELRKLRDCIQELCGNKVNNIG